MSYAHQFKGVSIAFAENIVDVVEMLAQVGLLECFEVVLG